MSADRAAALERLERRLGHHFSDRVLLESALTHTSFANEDASGEAQHNEPLEFLGDSILGFVVADLLHRRDPAGAEGEKSRARAGLVSTRSLARHAERLGIPELLRLGRGEEKTGGRSKTTLWADAYEALVAALYLDGGFEAARRFVEAEFAPTLEQERADLDAKSRLQELLQARGEPIPEYVVAAEEGPSHRPRFRVRCEVGGATLAEGEGSSKKQAQQNAARRALERLEAGERDPG